MAKDDLNVLVIGASGRVGRMLRRHWQAAPPRAMTLRYQARAAARPGDIVWDAHADPAELARHGSFDRVLVLAGVTPGPGADMMQNTAIAMACLAAAAEVGARHMLLASSAAVYGTANDAPHPETDPPAPASAYGIAKLEMERAAHHAARCGPAVTALRIGNVLGADALMLNAAHATDDAPVQLDRFVDGRGPVRSYIGPATLARVLETLLLMGTALPETLNIAAPHPVAMQRLLERSNTPYARRPAPPGAVQHITLDCRALATLHGFAADASSPAQMIAEWRALRDGA